MTYMDMNFASFVFPRECLLSISPRRSAQLMSSLIRMTFINDNHNISVNMLFMHANACPTRLVDSGCILGS